MSALAGQDARLDKAGAPLAGLRILSIGVEKSPVAIGDGTDRGRQEFLAAKVAAQGLTISVEGVAKAATLKALALTDSDPLLTDLRFVFADGLDIVGDFWFADYAEIAAYQDAVQFSATFISSGIWAGTAIGVAGDIGPEIIPPPPPLEELGDPADPVPFARAAHLRLGLTSNITHPGGGVNPVAWQEIVSQENWAHGAASATPVVPAGVSTVALSHCFNTSVLISQGCTIFVALNGAQIRERRFGTRNFGGWTGRALIPVSEGNTLTIQVQPVQNSGLQSIAEYCFLDLQGYAHG